MAKYYLRIALFLFCTSIFPNIGYSDQTNLSATTTDTKKSYNSEDMKTGTNSGDNKQPIETAIERTNKENKYLFLVFYKQNDQKSEAMKQVVAQSEKELSEKANFIHIDMADQNAQPVIKKYGIDESQIPITLAMAPNGAVVTGFPDTVNNDQLRNAFVSPKTADLIKSDQDKKLIYLYVANQSMKHYKENLNLLREMETVELKGAANIIEVDPRSKEESSLLEQFGFDASLKETTLLIISGGCMKGTLTGKLVKKVLLTKTKSNCCGG